MKNDALNHFKEEMNKRGLFRKIQVCANLIPPPPGADGETLIELQRSAAKIAIRNYAEHHEDFCDVMANAALDHLLNTVLPDDLFIPDGGFSPTKEEVDNMNRAKEKADKAAKVLDTLFGGLADLLKTL